MKTIKIKCCAECPYVLKLICGREYVCEHPSYMVKKPYSGDRKVDPETIADFCLL